MAFCYVSLNAELRKIWWRKTVKKRMGYTSKHRAKYSALIELFLGVDDIQSNDYVFLTGFGVILSSSASELTLGSS